MKKLQILRITCLVCFLFFVGSTVAQSNRFVKKIKINRENLYKAHGQLMHNVAMLYDTPFKPTGRFIAFSVVWYTNEGNMTDDEFRITFHSKKWGSTVFDIHPDGHFSDNTGRFVSELMFLDSVGPMYSIFYARHSAIDSLEIHFFDPGPTSTSITNHPVCRTGRQSPITTSNRTACPCPQPAFEGRLDWCPDGSCPPDPTPEFVPNPTHIIIHHSAGPNVATDWAAVVRSFWDYHVNVNGWDDIGYNWLVDPNGVLYEGRGDGRLGAHFCAQNGNTIGICVIGDFTDTQPTDEAIGELEDYLAWDCCDKNISPLDTGFHSGSGLVLPFIAGHRDGCMTSCPGDAFYPLLPEVRQATQDRIDSGCGSGVLAAPTVLAITYVGASKISLSWQDNAVGETGYSIERSETTDDNFSQIVQLPGNAMAFSDNNVSPDNTYFYRVRAKQGTEFSAYSNVAVAVTSLSATESRLHGGTASIYPNPTTGFLNLSIDNQWVGQTELSVFDAMGRMAIGPFFEEKNSGEASIKLDLSGLPAGVFIVKLAQGEEVGWFRVVKN